MLKKLIAATALLCCANAQAAYPDHAVTIVVSNPPGGPVDITLRLLANELGKRWHQSVIVENKPGASGIISTNYLAKSAPDGHTLGMVVASAITIMPFTVDKLPFDPVRDLQPISLVARTPFLFVVAANSPIKTWQDFVQRAKGGNVSLGSSSIGTAFHLVWEQTARRAGITALYVPTPSFTKTQSDLVGGQLDAALDAPSSAKGLLDAGKLRAIAITSPQRLPTLPGVPTLEESGMPGYAPQPWIGLMGPAGMDPAIVAKIQGDLAAVLKQPDVRKQMQMLGMIPIGSTPKEFADAIAQDRADMQPLIKELGIKLNP